MTAQDVLRGAKELLADEGRWCRGALARTADGDPVLPEAGRAVSWCAIGAMERVSGGGCYGAAWESLTQAVRPDNIPGFNNDPNTTHADLMDAIDRALLSLAPEPSKPAKEAAVTHA